MFVVYLYKPPPAVNRTKGFGHGPGREFLCAQLPKKNPSKGPSAGTTIGDDQMYEGEMPTQAGMTFVSISTVVSANDNRNVIP